MIRLGNGIEIQGEVKLALDAKREEREGINIISHAHKDHLGRVKKAVATKETAKLAGLDEYKDKFMDKDIEVRLVNAGHILGSSQIEILNGHHIVYTGDIRLRDSILMKGADVLDPEVLIIESTFGLPHFKFPDYEVIYSEIGRWVKSNLRIGRHVVIGSYALGKAQEITKLMNELGETPIVTRDIWENNNKYTELGVNLGNYLLAGTDEANETARDPSVFIVPMKLAGWKAKRALELSYGRPSVSGVTTGWALVFTFKSKGVDRAFPLSDHADFHDLVEYAKSSGAKKIYTVHGYKNELARELMRQGLNAEPLE